MPTFTKFVTEATRKPPATTVIPPSAFATKWEGRPSGDVCVGLCLVSEADIETGRSQAAMTAWQLHPHPRDDDLRIETLNNLTMRWIIARGTCDPNDVSEPFELWRNAPEDIVREALSVEGVKMLWDELEKLALAQSPVQREAEDNELELLALAGPDALYVMDPIRARRIRRLVAFCMDEIAPYTVR